MTRPPTPKDLELAGYRIEFGDPFGALDTSPVHLYWWTWTMDGGGIEASPDAFETADEAIESAREDMVDNNWDAAKGYFGLDQSFMWEYPAQLEYVQEMFAQTDRDERARRVLEQVLAVINMTNPGHPTYADSCADAVDALCHLEAEICDVLGVKPFQPEETAT